MGTSSKRTCANMLHLPGLLLPVPLTLWQATVNPPVHWRILYTHRQVWLSFLWSYCSFLLGPGAHKILLVPSKSLFPQSCGNSVIKSHWLLKSDSLRIPSPVARSQVRKFVVGPTARTSLVNCSPACGLSARQLYGGMNGDLPKIYATYSASHDCCFQWPCPCSRPLLTHISAGGPQTLREVWLSLLWGSLLHSLGPGVHMVLFVPSKSLWQVLGLALKLISPVLPSCCSFSFVLGGGVSLFGGFQHPPRPFRYDINQIPYDFTVEVRNIFKD